MRCEECGSEAFDTSRGDHTCKQCGMVHEIPVFENQQPRTFNNDDKQKRLHTEKDTLGLGTVMKIFSPKMKKLATIHARVKSDDERGKKLMKKKIKNLERMFLELSRKIRLTSDQESLVRSEILGKCLQNKEFIKRVNKNNERYWIQAILYVGCKRFNLPHDANSIASMCDTVKEKKIYYPTKRGSKNTKQRTIDLKSIRTSLITMDKMLDDDKESSKYITLGLEKVTDLMCHFPEFTKTVMILKKTSITDTKRLKDVISSALDVIDNNFTRVNNFKFSNVTALSRRLEKILDDAFAEIKGSNVIFSNLGKLMELCDVDFRRSIETRQSDVSRMIRKTNHDLINNLADILSINKKHRVKQTAKLIADILEENKIMIAQNSAKKSANSMQNRNPKKKCAIFVWFALNYHDQLMKPNDFQAVANISDPSMRYLSKILEMITGITILDYADKRLKIMKLLNITKEKQLISHPSTRGRVFVDRPTPIGKMILDAINADIKEFSLMTEQKIKITMAENLFSFIEQHEARILDVLVPLSIFYKFSSLKLSRKEFLEKCYVEFPIFDDAYIDRVLDLDVFIEDTSTIMVEEDLRDAYKSVMVPFLKQTYFLLDGGVTSLTTRKAMTEIENDLRQRAYLLERFNYKCPKDVSKRKHYVDWNDARARNIFDASKRFYVSLIHQKLKGKKISLQKELHEHFQKELTRVGISSGTISVNAIKGLTINSPTIFTYAKFGIPTYSYWKNKTIEEFLEHHKKMGLL